MTIYRSKRDGNLYLLSIFTPHGWCGRELQSMPYVGLHSDGTPAGNNSWKNVPAYKTNDFVPVALT